MDSVESTRTGGDPKKILLSLLTLKDKKLEYHPIIGKKLRSNRRIRRNFNSVSYTGTLIQGFVVCRKCSALLVKRKSDNSNLIKHLKLHQKVDKILSVSPPRSDPCSVSTVNISANKMNIGTIGSSAVDSKNDDISGTDSKEDVQSLCTENCPAPPSEIQSRPQ